MRQLPNVEELTQEGKRVFFEMYLDEEFWYKCEDGFTFPISIHAIRNFVFLREDKASIYKEYIQRHIRRYVRLNLVQGEDLVLRTLEESRYQDNEQEDESILEDRPHKEVGKYRVIGQMPTEAWVILQKHRETGETNIFGVARTYNGAIRLMETALKRLSLTDIVSIHHLPFIEGVHTDRRR